MHLDVKCLLFFQGYETNVPTYFLCVLNTVSLNIKDILNQIVNKSLLATLHDNDTTENMVMHLKHFKNVIKQTFKLLFSNIKSDGNDINFLSMKI